MKTLHIGLLSVSVALGCGSTSPAPASAPPPVEAPHVANAYRTTSAGVISLVNFTDATHYWMTVSGPCPTGQARCVESGSYAFKSEGDSIVFTDAATGGTRSLSFKGTSPGTSGQAAALHLLGGGLLGGGDGGADAASVSLVEEAGVALTSGTPVALTAFNLGSQSFTTAKLAQMNDISVLFPLATSSAQLAEYLSPTAKGATGVLLPQDLYTTAVSGVKPPTVATGPAYSTLRAVAFRIDPCTLQVGTITSGTMCTPTLRIVFQTFAKAGNADDDGFHAIYVLTNAQFLAAVNDIIALRDANGGSDSDGPGTLTIHPLVAKQGLSGKMAKGLNAEILKFCGAGNLIKIAAFDEAIAEHFSWTFETVDISGGAATPAPIPTDSTTSTVSEVTSLNNNGGALVLDIDTTSSDNIGLLLSIAGTSAAAPALQTAYDSTIHVLNPSLNSAGTIDCVSCHAAAYAALVGHSVYHLTSDSKGVPYAPNPAVVPASSLVQRIPNVLPTSTQINFHAFSYDGKLPMINQRVINETAFDLEYINSQLLAAPASQRSSDAGR